MKKYLNKYNNAIIPLIILIMALLMRTSFINLSIYDADVIQHLKYSDNISEGKYYFGGVRPTTIENSREESFGPFRYYLLAPIRYLTKDYNYTIIFIGILNSLAVLITYLLLNKFFNKFVAIVASLFYALSPWAVSLTSYSALHSILPIIVILNIYFLFDFISNNKKLSLIFLALTLGIAIQVYLAGIQLIFIDIAALLFTGKIKWKNIKYYLISTIIFIITLIPFLINNHIRGRNIMLSIKEVLLYPIKYANNSLLINIRDSIGIPIILGTNYFQNYLFGSYEFINSILIKLLYYSSSAILAILIILGSLYVLIRIYKKEKKYLILGIWAIIPILLMLIRNKNVAPNHYITLLPLPYILISLGIYFLYKKTNKNIIKKTIIITTILLLLISTFFTIKIFTRADELGGSNGTYGIPYKYKLAAVDYVINNDKEANVYYITRFDEYNELFKFKKFKGKLIYIENINEIENANGYLFLDNVTLDSPRKPNNQENKIIENNTKEIIYFGKLQVITL